MDVGNSPISIFSHAVVSQGFFAVLHLRVLDGVGGSDVVVAGMPSRAAVFFDVRVISSDRDEEVNCANDDYH